MLCSPVTEENDLSVCFQDPKVRTYLETRLDVSAQQVVDRYSITSQAECVCVCVWLWKLIRF